VLRVSLVGKPWTAPLLRVSFPGVALLRARAFFSFSPLYSDSVLSHSFESDLFPCRSLHITRSFRNPGEFFFLLMTPAIFPPCLDLDSFCGRFRKTRRLSRIPSLLVFLGAGSASLSLARHMSVPDDAASPFLPAVDRVFSPVQGFSLKEKLAFCLTRSVFPEPGFFETFVPPVNPPELLCSLGLLSDRPPTG